MNKNIRESELAARILDLFKDFHDIRVLREQRILLKDEKCSVLDFLIEYGEKAFAAIELKSSYKSLEALKTQFSVYQQSHKDIKCLIGCVDNEFYLYHGLDNKLLATTFEEILTSLVKAIENSEEDFDKSKFPDNWLDAIGNEKAKDYKQILHDIFIKNQLKQHGNYIYFDKKNEILFMSNLLNANTQDKLPLSLCRYCSAKSFFMSLLKKKFHVNNIYTMNDTLESTVIDDYENLKDERTTITDRLYQGYVMCFSSMERKEKLYNWYMYGDKTKGVCFTIDVSKTFGTEEDEEFVFAPVVYIKRSENQRQKEYTQLNFLNDLMDLTIEGKDTNQYHFKLRLWHYWKYFFKYDFYEDEQETRLVFFSKNNQEQIYNYDESAGKFQHYIEKGLKDMPFKITECMTGCNCGNNQKLLTTIYDCLAEGPIPVVPSSIVGFRPD